MEGERIVAAAIWKDGLTFTMEAPARHHDIAHAMAEKFGIHDNTGTEQGFLTNAGEFVRRKPALIIAERAGQLRRRQDPGSYQGPELFSEDLW